MTEAERLADELLPTAEEIQMRAEQDRRRKEIQALVIAAEDEPDKRSVRARCADLAREVLANEPKHYRELPDTGIRVREDFAPCPFGVEVGDHLSVIRQWEIEEELSTALSVGGAIDTVILACKTVAAKQMIKAIETADAHLRADGDKLWIGPYSKLPPGVTEMVPLIKPELLALLQERNVQT